MGEDDDYKPESGLRFAILYTLAAIVLIIAGVAACSHRASAQSLNLYLPPIPYDHSYQGPVSEKIVPFYKISEYCGPSDNDPARRAGCSIWILGFCHIIIADLPPEQQIEVRRHEHGHCNEMQATLLANSAHVGWRNPPPKINWVQIPNKR